MAAERKVSEQLRRRQVAGLLIILTTIVLVSIYRAGFSHVFPRGWWHIW